MCWPTGGFTNTQTSMINTIRALSYLGCMFAAPLFFRTLGYRLGTAVAVAFSAVSFAVFAASKTLAGFYLGGVLAGIGYGFGSMIPATILINRWFHRKKGLAIGLCSASTGLAMIVFSPILTAICETRGCKPASSSRPCSPSSARCWSSCSSASRLKN